ncbi:MAG: DUF998 domain-containing protein [Bacteroidales bacterium]|nr:DUF998 domain-containing protein [Bacteroidales bacterium]
MSKNLQKTTFAICIAACIGDVLISSVIGLFYPGYSHLRNTLSQLGASISPVASIMSIWWIILGSLFVVFGVLFGQVIKDTKYYKLSTWLIISYGVGEGICSGLFPVDYSSNEFNLFSELHIVLSGIGVLAVFLLPIILQKVFPKSLYPKFYWLSYFAIFMGLFFIILFSVAKMYDDPNIFISAYKGLWQRLISLNFYIYFISLSFVILKLDRKELS